MTREILDVYEKALDGGGAGGKRREARSELKETAQDRAEYALR